MILLIVNLAKCKKIESFLGSGYKCVASKGHIRDCEVMLVYQSRIILNRITL